MSTSVPITPGSQVTVTHEEAFQHLITNVLQWDKDHPGHMALTQNGFNVALDLVVFPTYDLQNLDYVVLNDTCTLNVVNVNKLKLLQSLLSDLWEDPNAFVLPSALMQITSNDFISKQHAFVRANVSSLPAPTPTKTSQTRPILTPKMHFQRTIKRDKTQYDILKSGQQWESWYLNFVATARSHGFENIMDPTYKPSTRDDIELFHEHQKFVYSVLVYSLQTDKGKELVRDHLATSDAQSVFAKLVDHYQASTSAQMRGGDILTYLTSAKYSPQQGSATKFILHFKTQLDHHSNLHDSQNQLSPALKKTLLENAVSDVPLLCSVKTTADIDVTKGGAPLTFEQYQSLLEAAATVFDKQNRASRGKMRKVLQHEFYSDPYDMEWHPGTSFDPYFDEQDADDNPYMQPHDMYAINKLNHQPRFHLQGILEGNLHPDLIQGAHHNPSYLLRCGDSYQMKLNRSSCSIERGNLSYKQTNMSLETPLMTSRTFRMRSQSSRTRIFHHLQMRCSHNPC